MKGVIVPEKRARYRATLIGALKRATSRMTDKVAKDTAIALIYELEGEVRAVLKPDFPISYCPTHNMPLNVRNLDFGDWVCKVCHLWFSDQEAGGDGDTSDGVRCPCCWERCDDK